jgi:multiple antibiotic resistance protein
MNATEFLGRILNDYLVLFAMVNAVGNLPIFALYTEGMTGAERNRTFRIAVTTAVVIVIMFALFGDFMLRRVFEVSTASFKIAGGILVFAVAARGVLSGQRQPDAKSLQDDNIAVFPLGFPFLAGPGTIVTIILLFQGGGMLVTVGAIVLVYLSIIPLLRLAPFVERVIGRLGVLIVSRILYIFICAKAVSFVIAGIQAAF